MIRSKCFFLYPILFLIIFCHCANPVTPEGGKKDITPPKVVDCDPPLLTTHFKKKEIRITFNEYIQLKDQSSQVHISPPLKHNFDLQQRGKSIFIKLSDTLKANSTYSFNFGDAISDFTEGNILHGFTYTFSTGSYIDSLSLSGKITNAFDLTPEKDVIAMLYINENDTLPLDSLPFHVKPYYFAKANENGDFTFRNLRNVPFLLFALKDLNSDYIYNPPNEKIAYCDSLARGTYEIPPSPDTLKKDSIAKADSLKQKRDTLTPKNKTSPVYALRLFMESDSIQKVLKADLVNEDQIAVYFRYPTNNPEFIPLNLNDTSRAVMIKEFNATKDSVYLWLANTGKDTLKLRLTDKNTALDTVHIDLTKKTPRKKKSDKVSPHQFSLKLATNVPDAKLNYFKREFLIIASYPLAKYDFSRILLVDAKDTIKPKLAFADSVKRRLRVSYKWKEDHPYRLIIPDSIFTSVNGHSNDSMVVSFRTHSLRDFGSILMNINIKNPSGNYIIQLLDEKENVLEHNILSTSGKVKFEYLSPAKYKIKVIYDSNRNGRWDTGNFSRKIQPERVQYYQKTIEVHANWDIDETWEL